MNLPYALSLSRFGLMGNGEGTEIFSMESVKEKGSEEGTEYERRQSYSNRDTTSVQDTTTSDAIIDNFNSVMAALALRSSLFGFNGLEGNMLYISPLSLLGLGSSGGLNCFRALSPGYVNILDNFDRLFPYPGNTIMLNSEISLRRLDDSEITDSPENDQKNSLTLGEEIGSTTSYPTRMLTDTMKSLNSKHISETLQSANENLCSQNFIQVDQCTSNIEKSSTNSVIDSENDSEVSFEKGQEEKNGNGVTDVSPLQVGEISQALENENMVLNEYPRKPSEVSGIADFISGHSNGYQVMSNEIKLSSSNNSCGLVTDSYKFQEISVTSNNMLEKLASGSGRKFVCSLCGKKYHSEEILRQHEALHSGKKNFPCTVCGKEFSREHSMLTHKRIHTEEKNFKCDLCGKGFYWKSCLRRHMDVHIDDKDFTCPICGKVFVNKSYVAGHMAVHTGEKKFKCEICGKGFSFKVSLRKHTVLHTQGRQKAGVCGKESFQQSTLHLHQVGMSLGSTTSLPLDSTGSVELGDKEKTSPSQDSDNTIDNLVHSDQGLCSSECDKMQTNPKDFANPKNVQADNYTGNLSYSTKSEFEHLEEKKQNGNFNVPADSVVVKDSSQGSGTGSPIVGSSINHPVLCGTNSKTVSGTTATSSSSTVSETVIAGSNISVSEQNADHINEIKPPDLNRKYGCIVCGKRFHSKANLLRHEMIHSGKKNFPCGICGKEFSREYNLINHRRIHTAEKNYKCDLCGKEFYWKSCLTRHMGVHIDEKDFTCPICGKVFFNKSYVRGHMVVHTGEKRFKCEICGKGFSFKVSLKKHKIMHTNEKNVKCDICGKEFFQKSNLNLHRAVHTSKKKFVCEFCGKIFSSKVLLVDHVALHTGEFRCTVCNENFSDSTLLVQHMTVHEGNKDYPKHKCDLCGKTFNKKSNLLLHKVVHTGKKDFSCEICGKSYYHKFNLAQHMVIHTGPIKCNVCGKEFARQAQLNRHMVIHTVLMNRQAGEIFPSVAPVSDVEDSVFVLDSQKDKGDDSLPQESSPVEGDSGNTFIDENSQIESILPVSVYEESKLTENITNSVVGENMEKLSDSIFTVETMVSEGSSSVLLASESEPTERDIGNTVDGNGWIEGISPVDVSIESKPTENVMESFVGESISSERLSGTIFTVEIRQSEDRSEESWPAEKILDENASDERIAEDTLATETEATRNCDFETDITVDNIKVETFETEPLEPGSFEGEPCQIQTESATA
ncbi:zinc finger protein 62 homolog [Macrobrachium nipponense]|uniref:zinc finger protein 62 homolog n=1 Tax=Macrobrachium nipponense TaxID=159736 RepID=UPI0030C7EA44